MRSTRGFYEWQKGRLPMLLMAAGFAFALGLVPSSARAMPSGTVIITDHQMDPKSPTFEKDLKKAQKASLTKDAAGWHVYFVAYLKKVAGSTDVNLVFYDLTEGKGAQGNAYPIGTQADAKIIMSDILVNPEQDFKAGHKYDVRITRLVNGKEDIYARTKLELK